MNTKQDEIWKNIIVEIIFLFLDNLGTYFKMKYFTHV